MQAVFRITQTAASPAYKASSHSSMLPDAASRASAAVTAVNQDRQHSAGCHGQLTSEMKPRSPATCTRLLGGSSLKVTRAPSTPGTGKYFSLGMLRRHRTAAAAEPLNLCKTVSSLQQCRAVQLCTASRRSMLYPTAMAGHLAHSSMPAAAATTPSTAAAATHRNL